MPLPDQPHISVILPIRNGMPHLQRTLEGLLAQTYKNFTLIIQDGVSTDGSLEYLRGLDSFFPIDIVSEYDGSVTIGYSRCFKRARGDLVVAVACDEVLDPNALETYVGWYKEHPDAVFIYGGTRIVTDDTVRGRLIQVFQPPAFNLFDYVRHRMCPSTAGAFNRSILGDDLHLDETLKTCPDFELIMRLALKHGSDKVITKRAVTMSARGDATSMSFRPESHTQFARDKTTVTDRLLTGNLAPAFLSFVKSDLLHTLHIGAANAIYDVAGDCPEYAEQLLEADRYAPNRPLTKQVIGQTRFAHWNPELRKIEREIPAPPGEPDPARAQVEQVIDLRHFMTSPDWQAMGAAVRPLPNGQVEIDTMRQEGFSATLPFDMSKLDFKNNWYWLYTQYQVKKGFVTYTISHVGSGETDRMVIFQKNLYQSPQPLTQCVYLKPARQAALIIGRSGIMVYPEKRIDNEPSQITFFSAAIIKTPKPKS